jgi:hypothetical protein
MIARPRRWLAFLAIVAAVAAIGWLGSVRDGGGSRDGSRAGTPQETEPRHGVKRPSLELGERVRLGEPAAAPFIGSGWGEAETSYRWTVGPRAELYFGAPSAEAAVLRLRVHPFVAEGGPDGQRVVVSLNGTIAATLALRSPEAAEHVIPLLDGLGAANTLAFDLPDAALPRGDLRPLGMAVHWLRLDPLPVLVRGHPVPLGEAEGAPFVGEGWAEPERTTRWSVGMKAELLFAVERPGPARLVLAMEPFATRGAPKQRVRVDLNDQRLTELMLEGPGRHPREIVVPEGVMRRHNLLRLILPDARSPASQGQSADRRVLGVRVSTLELR